MQNDNYLSELHRQHAALVNNHMHHDLKDMDPLQRQVAISDTLDRIEEAITFEKQPWNNALDKAKKGEQ